MRVPLAGAYRITSPPLFKDSTHNDTTDLEYVKAFLHNIRVFLKVFMESGEVLRSGGRTVRMRSFVALRAPRG